jgi:hypothetical protein
VPPPPIGFVTLQAAVDDVGRKLVGSIWRPIAERQDLTWIEPDIDPIIKAIAEACERGELAAAYRSVTGADVLDCSLWRMPHWRSYFARGAIDLDLPWLDHTLRPIMDGRTVRCPGREIFIRKDSLKQFLASLELVPPLAAGHYGSDGPLLEEMRRLVASGVTVTRASQQLAPRAEGATVESRARRLREKYKVLRED